jgi:hypothetical protein
LARTARERIVALFMTTRRSRDAAGGRASDRGDMNLATRLRCGVLLATVVALGVGLLASPASANGVTPGYWLLGSDGGVFAFGVPFHGSAASPSTLCAPNTSDRGFPDGTCLAFAATPDGGGYWILNVDTGTITAFGNAGDFGEPADDFVGTPREFVPTGRAIASTPDGQGYWVLEIGLSGAGTVMPFGSAQFFGDTATLLQQSSVEFHGEPVGLVPTPSGAGYWEVYSDGGVFGFGDAGFFGSTGGIHLNQPIVGMAATPDGLGYWLVASDGGVFAFGNAVFHGSTGGIHLNKPIVGIARNADGTGYWLVGSDGGIFAFGSAPFLGSTGGATLARPVVGIATG